MAKYSELQYQLDGLKNAIEKIEHGIEEDNFLYIRAEMRYFKEKASKVQNEAEEVIFQAENEKVVQYRAVIKGAKVDRIESIWFNSREEAVDGGEKGLALYNGTEFTIESSEEVEEDK